jgi:hypothetical protein
MSDPIILAYYDPIILAYFDRRVMDICKETGSVCDRWVDNDVYSIYLKYDEKHGTDTADEYLSSCHVVHFSAKPPNEDKKEWEFELRCKGPIKGKYETCDFCNEEAKLILQKEFLESLKSFAKK